MGYHGYLPTGQTAAERRKHAEMHGTGWAGAKLICAHHAARGRAEARDRRVRDEDLALGGRPRLHAGNCQAMMQDEWGWW